MSKYTPRLIAPNNTNKNWVHYSKSGYNYCILIKGTSVLPNCVGYAWGRWRELLGKYHNLSRGNAERWFGNKGDGYKRGQAPKLGAIICWRKGRADTSSDGAGHVGVVEKINSDGSIVISNSNYSGTRFYLLTLKAPYNVGTNYHFQGFIYNPTEYKVEKLQPKPNKTIADVVKEVITGQWGNGQERKDRLTNAGYDYKVVQNKVKEVLSTTAQPRFKKGDKVIPTNLVDYDGRFLKKYDDIYEVLEDSKADRVVLAARRNGKLVVWAAMNIKNVRRV